MRCVRSGMERYGGVGRGDGVSEYIDTQIEVRMVLDRINVYLVTTSFRTSF